MFSESSLNSGLKLNSWLVFASVNLKERAKCHNLNGSQIIKLLSVIFRLCNLNILEYYKYNKNEMVKSCIIIKHDKFRVGNNV